MRIICTFVVVWLVCHIVLSKESSSDESALKSEIRAFMGNLAVPQSSKESFISDIKALHEESVLAETMSSEKGGNQSLVKEGLSGGRNCCTVQPPPITESYHHRHSNSQKYYYAHKWNTGCGVFWLGRCNMSRKLSAYRSVYYMQTHYRYAAVPCQVFDCCAGKVWIEGTGLCTNIGDAKRALEKHMIGVATNE